MTAKAYDRGTQRLREQTDRQLAESQKHRDYTHIAQENKKLKVYAHKRTAQTKRVLTKARQDRAEARHEIQKQRSKALMLFQKLEKEIAARRRTQTELDELREVIAQTMTPLEFRQLLARVRDE